METNFFKKGVFERVDKAHKIYVENLQYLECVQEYYSRLISKTDRKSNDPKIHETDKTGIFLNAISRRATFLKTELDKIKKEKITIKFHSKYDGALCKKELLKNINYINSGKDKALYNSDLTNLYNSISCSKSNLKDEIIQHYNQFIREMGDYFNFIYKISKFVSMFDLIVSKAYISHKYDYCKPTIKDPKEWSEWKGKHHSAFFQLRVLDIH